MSLRFLALVSFLALGAFADPVWVDWVDYECVLNNNHLLHTMTGSVSDCKTWCESQSTCTGFDYVVNTAMCYMTSQNCLNGNSNYLATVGTTFYGRATPAPPSSPVSSTCNTAALPYFGSQSTTFACPAGCATGGDVFGSGQYSATSSVCRAAVHAGALTNANGGDVTVTWTGAAPYQAGSTAHGVTTISAYAPQSFTFGSYTPAVTCSDVHFWVPESTKLAGQLQRPQVINNNFDNRLYTNRPDLQAPAITGCQGAVSFSITGTSAPFHHTQTEPGYTPAYGPFSLSPNGDFTYIHLPTKTNNQVWNGYDYFTFSISCGNNAPTPQCSNKKAFINVVRTSAVGQNTAPAEFVPAGTFPEGVKCDPMYSCKQASDSIWLTRQTLPRVWDVQRTESGAAVRPTVSAYFGGGVTDGLDFEWMSNYALISTYGVIGTMSVRFPTFEVVEWQPGQNFEPSDFNGLTSNPNRRIAATSTGFTQNCLVHQGNTGLASDVWTYNSNQQDGQPAGLYNTGASWYQKFGGKHDSCNIFTGLEGGVRRSCRYAPLLSPRTTDNENQAGIWRLEVKACDYKWQGKFTWNAMRNQVLSNGQTKVWAITGGQGADYVLTTEIYNQAVQPNSWTEPARGFVETDTKYLLKVVLASDTDFQFQMGIDIFTVDLQQFRFNNVYQSQTEQAFGFNMIVYPTRQNALQQSAPDRRIVGYKWVEQKWLAPNQAQCPNCAIGGRVGALTETANTCTSAESTDASAYTSNTFPQGNCGRGDGVVVLFKGPATTDNECSNNDPMIIKGYAGISAAPGANGACKTTYQNITLRGSAPGSSETVSAENGFGFEGRITLTFALANGEHPHFVIEPRMYVKSISINGAFSGSSSTCRGSPKWPVQSSSDIPQYICEEPDARTFGPTDWAAIFFDIKDVDANLVQLKSLYIQVNTLNIRFFPGANDQIPGVTTSFHLPQYSYFNYRELSASTLVEPSHPVGVEPPKKTDFGFAFTPGAHNENMKITIYCTLSIKQSTTTKRRFASQQASDNADNTMQERISITQRTSTASSVSSSNNQVVESGSVSNASSTSGSSSVTVMVLAAACAVLLAAVIGLVLYVVRQNGTNAPKRVSSTA